MDRNLGATRAATSATDTAAYGDLYQWGRGSDGHQCRISTATGTLSSSDQAGHGQFIISNIPPVDWRNPQNTNLWQGVNGINNPCPSGYRLPTETELNAELLSWNTANSVGAFASPLKLPIAGWRNSPSSGAIQQEGSAGWCWSSSVFSTSSRNISFGSSDALMSVDQRAFGVSVRCIKDASAITGTVDSINCGTATNTGTLTQGTAASGVSSSVPYTGGNGGSHSGQTVTSTGVTGLTATLSSGTFANGNGTLVYNITGTPSASGTASFALSIGGQTCALNLSVAINLVTQYPAGSVFCASGPTAIVDVTNPITGKIWMDRNLGASQAATSSTDVNSYGDIYQWGRGNDGHQCRNSATTSSLSTSDQPGNGNFIIITNNPYDWRSTQNDNLWQGINGTNNPCPNGYRIPTDNELSQERSSWSSDNSFGAYNSPLKLSMTGYRNVATGVLTRVNENGYIWSSTISGTSSRNLIFSTEIAWHADDIRASGESIRCIKDPSAITGTVNSINCGSATNTGALTQGTAASGVSSSVPYTGGNGGSHSGQTVTSTGVAGLTATLSSGTFANGNGTLVYSITGTPSASGTASFALNIGGQTCTLNLTVSINLVAQYPTGSVFCSSGPTEIVDVTNPITGKIWMDRNLGASRAATSSTDALSYGDLYQWGRGSDGHQCRNSSTTNQLSSANQPANDSFITNARGFYDWRSPQNPNLWQGVNGINNPCPSGYRLPTSTEFNDERLSWSSNNINSAFVSILKLPIARRRENAAGEISTSTGAYWTSSTSASYSHFFGVSNSNDTENQVIERAVGLSVRCIKN